MDENGCYLLKHVGLWATLRMAWASVRPRAMHETSTGCACQIVFSYTKDIFKDIVYLSRNVA